MEFKNFFESTANGDLEFLQKYADKGIPVGDIGMPKSSLYRLLDKYGIKRNRRSKNPEDVLKFHRMGWSVNDIAAYTTYSPKRVRFIINQAPPE